MRRLSSDTLTSLDTELERTLGRIRKGNREAVESERITMENLQDVGNEEDIESRNEGRSHPSTPRMAHSPRALRDNALPLAGTPSVIRRPLIQENNFELKSITL